MTKPLATATAISRTEFLTASVLSNNSPASAAATTFVTNRFEWRQVESDDWEQLASNLRAVGCPEKTIRDLVLARAQRATDQIARGHSRLPFWTAGIRLERDTEARERLWAATRTKIRATLGRAVGLDFDPSAARQRGNFEEQTVSRFVIGPMPEEKYQQLVVMMKRLEERTGEVSARCQGVQLNEDIAELKQLQAQFARDVSALLSREEFDEFNARCAMINFHFHGGSEVKFEATDLTPSEVRQIALIRARVQGPASDLFRSSHATTDEEDEQIRVETSAFLGERRAAEFERAADSDFQRLFDLGSDNNLPRDTAVRAFDLRKLAEQEAGQLREDKSLSDAQRRQRLEQVQAETQAAMLQTLGATACQQYLQRGGEWLTNFNKL